MEEEKKHFNPFNFLKKEAPKQSAVVPTRIKPDGTKVIEEETPFGKTIYEIKPNGLLISMTYEKMTY